MDVSHLLAELNEAQRAAVTTGARHSLVLAGAGSGKTRVLVHRLAWLIRVEHVHALGILAVTFTNKAAGEMRSRTERMLDAPLRGMWVGTFHGLAHRLLRAHHEQAGLPAEFQILDSEDQLRALRRVLRDIGADEKQWPAREAQWRINTWKDEGLRPADIDIDGHPQLAGWRQIYETYETHCRRGALVDFAELLLRALETLRDQPELLAHYRQRFSHILVDEFQDTNTIQYEWLRLIAGDRGSLFVVGDDDQSIYGWRGARVANIDDFVKAYRPEVLRLEQNYRSTGSILAAANAVIAHNASRLGKQLWTSEPHGPPVQFYLARDDLEEAEFIITRIERWRHEGRRYAECALLYRSNAQSRMFEQVLAREAIPYRVYGGLRFFERAEIKDALAYLRLVNNPGDDAAFERVVNTPLRGIGERTLAELRTLAGERRLPLWQAARQAIAGDGLAPRHRQALAAFVALIEQLRAEVEALPLGAQMSRVIAASGLETHYAKEGEERLEARRENLRELERAAGLYTLADEDAAAGLTPRAAFLAQAALEAGDTQAGKDSDGVQLMTLHSAKGLEFPLVFIAGLEEGLFPHQKSAEEAHKLEEERRLCYVGMTRAREWLYLTAAETRRLYGNELRYCRTSRFIDEIPENLLAGVRSDHRGADAAPPALRRAADGAGIWPLQLGAEVMHDRFGEGTVLQIEGTGQHTRVHVRFRDAGAKWLVLSHANLQTVR